MTARQIFEGMLIELSKVHAPSLLLQDFNYLFNKAINLYINKRYNIYDINQLTTDDLRVLKSTAVLTPQQTYTDTSYTASSSLSTKVPSLANLLGATFEVTLPSDYLHMLNCICVYKVKKTFKCYDAGSYVLFAAKRLTADAWSLIINDFYNRPLPERPYYYIHNINTSNDGTLPTNPFKAEDGTLGSGTDMAGEYKVTELDGGVEDVLNLPRTLKFDSDVLSLVEKSAANRYGNASSVRCEIRYGKDTSIFGLEEVIIDYIKSPLYIRLTQELLDLTEDTSQIMEFPDYVCLEIINELVTIVMENTADPRLQTHVAVSLSIALPAQQLTLLPLLAQS